MTSQQLTKEAKYWEDLANASSNEDEKAEFLNKARLCIMRAEEAPCEDEYF